MPISNQQYAPRTIETVLLESSCSTFFVEDDTDGLLVSLFSFKNEWERPDSSNKFKSTPWSMYLARGVVPCVPSIDFESAGTRLV